MDATATFDLPLAQHGSVFARRVWSAQQSVPVGGTRSYGELARALDPSEASRAVAQANGANQLANLVPCHRIGRAPRSIRRGSRRGWAQRASEHAVQTWDGSAISHTGPQHLGTGQMSGADTALPVSMAPRCPRDVHR